MTKLTDSDNSVSDLASPGEDVVSIWFRNSLFDGRDNDIEILKQPFIIAAGKLYSLVAFAFMSSANGRHDCATGGWIRCARPVWVYSGDAVQFSV